MKYFFLAILRDRMAFFMSLGFPFVLFILFGLVFSPGMSAGPGIPDIGFTGLDETWVHYLNYRGRAVPYENRDALLEAVSTGKVEFGMLEDDGRLQVMFRENDESLNRLNFLAILAAFMKDQGTLEPMWERKEMPILGDGGASGRLDSLSAGIIALSLLTAGLFGMINAFGQYRDQKVWKRILATPVSPYVILGFFIVLYLGLGLFSATLMLLLARYGFQVSLAPDPVQTLMYFLSALFAMLGLGSIIAVGFQKSRTALSFSSIFMTIMIFFSGIYFPVEFLPSSLRLFSRFLPLTYMSEIALYVLGVGNEPGYSVSSAFLVMFIGGLLALLYSGKRLVRSELR